MFLITLNNTPRHKTDFYNPHFNCIFKISQQSVHTSRFPERMRRTGTGGPTLNTNKYSAGHWCAPWCLYYVKKG